jgi:hypothetical protein
MVLAHRSFRNLLAEIAICPESEGTFFRSTDFAQALAKTLVTRVVI